MHLLTAIVISTAGVEAINSLTKKTDAIKKQKEELKVINDINGHALSYLCLFLIDSLYDAVT